jgi:hypothetical protein
MTVVRQFHDDFDAPGPRVLKAPDWAAQHMVTMNRQHKIGRCVGVVAGRPAVASRCPDTEKSTMRGRIGQSIVRITRFLAQNARFRHEAP